MYGIVLIYNYVHIFHISLQKAPSQFISSQDPSPPVADHPLVASLWAASPGLAFVYGLATDSCCRSLQIMCYLYNHNIHIYIYTYIYIYIGYNLIVTCTSIYKHYQVL